MSDSVAKIAAEMRKFLAAQPIELHDWADRLEALDRQHREEVAAILAAHEDDAADARRLDFLESTGWPGQFVADPTRDPARRWFDCETTGSDYNPTLRAAIDAAIVPADVVEGGRE